MCDLVSLTVNAVVRYTATVDAPGVVEAGLRTAKPPEPARTHRRNYR
ncbi:hypothetical protein [Micromonospora sp. CNB394]|nr:hypothetical protein [Micromonospora sp. CNB394]